MILALLLAATPGGDAFRERVVPFVEQHCAHCHGGAHPEADLALDRFQDEPSARKDPASWRDVRKKLFLGEMPPEERPRPPAADVSAVIAWIDEAFGKAETASREIQMGKVGIRRLTRTEYENSVRDLLEIEYRASEEFPADDVGRGFDRIAEVLSTSDIGAEKFLLAAERIGGKAVFLPEPAHPPRRRTEAARLQGGAYGQLRNDAYLLYSNGDAQTTVRLPRDGAYVIRASAWGEPAGPEPPKIALRLDGVEIARFDVLAVAGSPAVYEKRVWITGGEHRVAASFVNDYYKPDDPNPANRDRNLDVQWLETVGPVDAPRYSAFQVRRLDPANRKGAREIVEDLAAAAWRRPPTSPDVDRLLALSTAEASVEERVRAGIMGILVSPRFLFLSEADPARTSSPSGTDPGNVWLDDWALAARLASFLWNSLPDERLRALAAKGALHERETIRREAERMIDDGRATGFAWDFAAQWLELPRLDRAAPDVTRFPGFSEPMRASMRAETELFFESVLREGRPAAELLAADYTFVDERLARHYGIPGVQGDTMRRVRLGPTCRGGLLGEAAILTLTSNPTRTSPSKRGKWILENLLGDPPPPPPPGVGVLDESRAAATSASLRERLTRHRSDPACSACHARIDPLGLALENLDPVGVWRSEDGGFTIDAGGELPDGRRFQRIEGLRDLLVQDHRKFERCLAEKLATYALSRQLTAEDEKDLAALLDSFGEPSPPLRKIVAGIAATDAFRRRGGSGT